MYYNSTSIGWLQKWRRMIANTVGSSKGLSMKSWIYMILMPSNKKRHMLEQMGLFWIEWTKIEVQELDSLKFSSYLVCRSC